MLIQSYLHPDLSVVRDVRALEAVCHAHDGLSGTLFLDPSLNFSPELPCLFTLREGEETVSLLTFFVPTQAEAELVGMTHPAHRGKGYFRALVRAAAEFARKYGVADLLFVCEPHSAAGVKAVSSFGARLDHTEYSLRYNPLQSDARLTVLDGLALREATAGDLGDMSAVASAAFSEPAEQARHFLVKSLEAPDRTQYVAHLNGEPAGVGAIGLEDGEATIFGLAVLPVFQGRGVGRGMVSLMLNELLSRDTKGILIEVDSTNLPALHLYRSCGFEPEATYGYYRAPLPQVEKLLAEGRV